MPFYVLGAQFCSEILFTRTKFSLQNFDKIGMLNLNLISQEDKDAFRFLCYRRAVLYLGGIASAVIVVFIILLIPSFLFLNAQRREVLRELATEESALRAFGTEEIERRIVLLNEKTARIRADATRERRASEIIATLVAQGESVRMEEARIDFAARAVEIKGTAPTRNALLALKESVEESGLVEKILIPIVDLVKLTNVSFTLKGALK